MRLLKAVVTANNRKTGLKIRTETGLVTTLSYDKKYNVGEKVFVGYNFTTNMVSRIFSRYEEGMYEPIPEEENNQEEAY